jgi:two-component system, chemotaxis family, chemotaxis protein CheY
MKILIVDDSKAMRMIVTRALKQAGFKNHTLEEATDGVTALQAIQASAPDLVLSDWNMPNMSGIELLEELKKQNLNIKFGFVTSEGTDEMKERALQSGALFLIRKPFTPEAFEQNLNGVL